jgi:hypothetical protein
MVLCGYKEIAEALSRMIGGSVSCRTARGYGVRDVDPIPVRRIGNRVFIDAEQLDIWLARQWRPAGRRNKQG